MSLLWQLDINQEILTSPTCSTLLEVRVNINDTVVKAFDSVITLNDIFITSAMCTCGQVKYSCHSYNGVMTTRVKANHNIWQGNLMLTQS